MNLSNEQLMWLIIGIVALLVLVALLIVASRTDRKRESEELRRKFGPEYEKAVADSKSRKGAEANLRHREERVENLMLRDLTQAQRDHYAQWWTQVQSMFVERPAVALAEADRLTTDLMRDRGYPATDRDSTLEDLSVRHANLVQRLRHANDLSRDERSVDHVREAMLDYRAVVAELLAVDLRTSQERESR